MMKLVIPIVWALAMFATRFVDPLPVVLLTALALAGIVVWREPKKFRALITITPPSAAMGAIAAAGMLAVTYLIVPAVIGSLPSIRIDALTIYARFLSNRNTLLMIVAVIPVVIAEEVVWRGAMQESMPRWTWILTPALYALAHAPAGSAVLVMVAFICGLYWSALRAMSGSLVPSLCAHLAWDIALIAFPLVLG